MKNRTTARTAARWLLPGVALCAALAAQNPTIRTVSLSSLRPAPRRTPPHAGRGLVFGAGGISAPVSPVSIVSANGGALGLYGVAGDAIASDSVSNQGGPQIVNTPVQVIFWGSAWPNAVGPSPAAVTAALKTILNDPYLSQMNQYGYQAVTLRGITYVTSPDPNPNYASTDAGGLVWNMIDQGIFSEPDESGGRILYMVIMPPGTTTPGTALGAHSDPWDYDFPAHVDYAWVGWIGYGSLDVITKVFSHELVEAISDPEPDTPAWTMNRSLNGGDEIGDACNNTSDFLDGVLMQAYWSQQWRACALPLGSGRPELKSMSNQSGPVTGGTQVIIQGRLFGNVSNVAFGGMPAASFKVDSMNQITATSPVFDENLYPNGERVLDVTVTTPFGSSASSAASRFAYYPVVSGVSPRFGSTDGGETVTVSGQGFLATRSTTIYFGAAISPNVYCNDSTQCVATAPPSGAGTVDVTASVGGIRSVPDGADRYTYSGPLVTAISPAIGPEVGGTYVHLNGFGFDQNTIARFGATLSNYVVCTSGTECTVRSPAGTGVANISVAVNGLWSPASASNQFTWAPFPAINTVVPGSGVATGGTKVTISGLNFSPNGTTIHFGSAPATHVACTPTQCTATAPPGISIVDVTAAVNGLTSLIAPSDKFGYIPVVTGVTPNKGSERGGTSVRISGAGLTSTQDSSYATVAFGPNQALTMSCAATLCNATSPAGTGVVDVRVTVDGHTSAVTPAGHFTYTPAGNPKGWTQWRLQPAGIESMGGVVTYDTLRRQVLYFDWQWPNGGQTYVWNIGTHNWQQYAPAASPRSIYGSMAFDEARGVAVLFGGWYLVGNPPPFRTRTDDTTWFWDGANWTAMRPAIRPPARHSATMVYDEWNQKIVLFGGCANTACSTRLNDTWTWDGANWKQESPTTIPPERSGAAMAYDPISGVSILFGGETAAGVVGDQWAWNGVNWIEMALPQPAPVARKQAGIAFSRLDSGLILFAGTGAAGDVTDTWLWNGTRWTLAAPGVSGASSTVVGMAWDAAMDAPVLLIDGSTWTWGGK